MISIEGTKAHFKENLWCPMALVMRTCSYVRIVWGTPLLLLFSSSRLSAGAGGCEKIEAERKKYLDLSGPWYL